LLPVNIMPFAAARRRRQNGSARVFWGTHEREAGAPKARSCFSGGTRMGEPEPERRRQTKAAASVDRRAREFGPNLCPEQKADQENDCSSGLIDGSHQGIRSQDRRRVRLPEELTRRCQRNWLRATRISKRRATGGRASRI
jgi:hypothetical protein